MAGGPIGLGMMVAGQLIGAAVESKGLSDAAAVDEENARRTVLEGALESEAIARAGRAVQGEAIAAQGANRAGVGSGSALDLVMQNQIEIEHSILNRRYGAATEAQGLRAAASQKRRASRYALFGGMLRAGAAALTGMDEMRDARSLRDANARLRAARLPGGQQMPIPAHLLPMPRGGHGSSPAAGGSLPGGSWLTPLGLPGD